jgi:hypothetical protein
MLTIHDAELQMPTVAHNTVLIFLALLRYIKNIIAHQHINNIILVKLGYFGVYLPKESVQ